MAPVLALPLLLAMPLATGAELDLRLSGGAEWDTNAARRVNTGNPSGDGVVRVLVDTELRLTLGEMNHVDVGYVLGAKRFVSADTEDLLVHDLSASTDHRPLSWLGLRSYGTLRASRIRSGLRDYALAAAGGSAGIWAADNFALWAGGGYSGFRFDTDERLSYGGPSLRGEVSWWPADRFSAAAHLEHAWRDYRGNALVPVLLDENGMPPLTAQYTYCDGISDSTMPPRCSPLPRDDTELSFGLRVAYRGSFVLGGEALARFQRSTSLLEDIDRYRLVLFGTFKLPWEVVLNVIGALQYNSGVSLTQALYLAEDDENQNSLGVQLSRKVTSELAVEARYTLYANEFATAHVRFFRQTFYLGLAFALESD